jgi:hypothetical protein
MLNLRSFTGMLMSPNVIEPFQIGLMSFSFRCAGCVRRSLIVVGAADHYRLEY